MAVSNGQQALRFAAYCVKRPPSGGLFFCAKAFVDAPQSQRSLANTQTLNGGSMLAHLMAGHCLAHQTIGALNMNKIGTLSASIGHLMLSKI
jgi:hypothetical protein